MTEDRDDDRDWVPPGWEGWAGTFGDDPPDRIVEAGRRLRSMLEAEQIVEDAHRQARSAAAVLGLLIAEYLTFDDLVRVCERMPRSEWELVMHAAKRAGIPGPEQDP